MTQENEPEKLVIHNRNQPIGEGVGFVLDFDEARQAAELYAIGLDLTYVTEICDLLEDRLLARSAGEQGEELRAPGIEDHVNRSLWIAALITYGRCFHRGIRYSLPESLFVETPEMDYTDLHRYFMNIRDKHLAHSVNELEAAEAVVSLDRGPDGSLTARTLRMVYVTMLNLHHIEVSQLGSMASYAGGFARDRYEELRRRTLEKTRGLSQKELEKLHPFSFRRREGFASRESAKAMKKARRGKGRKGKPGA